MGHYSSAERSEATLVIYMYYKSCLFADAGNTYITMSDTRHIPHYADITQFKNQAKELLKEFHEKHEKAQRLFFHFHPKARNLVNAKLADGFGGHTPLFHTVVSYITDDVSKAKVLLEKGADPKHRATLRKQLRYLGQPHLERMREFRHVTCIGFAQRFQVQRWVSKAAVEFIKQNGGVE